MGEDGRRETDRSSALDVLSDVAGGLVEAAGEGVFDGCLSHGCAHGCVPVAMLVLLPAVAMLFSRS